jgi:hypothetical protein
LTSSAWMMSGLPEAAVSRSLNDHHEDRIGRGRTARAHPNMPEPPSRSTLGLLAPAAADAVRVCEPPACECWGGGGGGGGGCQHGRPPLARVHHLPCNLRIDYQTYDHQAYHTPALLQRRCRAATSPEVDAREAPHHPVVAWAGLPIGDLGGQDLRRLSRCDPPACVDSRGLGLAGHQRAEPRGQDADATGQRELPRDVLSCRASPWRDACTHACTAHGARGTGHRENRAPHPYAGPIPPDRTRGAAPTPATLPAPSRTACG